MSSVRTLHRPTASRHGRDNERLYLQSRCIVSNAYFPMWQTNSNTGRASCSNFHVAVILLLSVNFLRWNNSVYDMESTRISCTWPDLESGGYKARNKCRVYFSSKKHFLLNSLVTLSRSIGISQSYPLTPCGRRTDPWALLQNMINESCLRTRSRTIPAMIRLALQYWQVLYDSHHEVAM